MRPNKCLCPPTTKPLQYFCCVVEAWGQCDPVRRAMFERVVSIRRNFFGVTPLGVLFPPILARNFHSCFHPSRMFFSAFSSSQFLHFGSIPSSPTHGPKSTPRQTCLSRRIPHRISRGAQRPSDTPTDLLRHTPVQTAQRN